MKQRSGPCARNSARICVLAFVGLLASISVAYSVDNGSSGPSTTQASCKSTADGDYRFNTKSCEDRLKGDNQQMGVCMQDAAADHQRALAACDKAARGAGGRIPAGGKNMNKSN